ncbi:MAG: glycosyltransferase [Saprospiraceae bacterium]|nr:glycosyltransferase [Saprospiraceae bacterium]
MKLSVIIVNYNVKYFLEQALLSVRRAGVGIDMEVWVVDNNSVDESVGMVREKFPEVQLIANTDNPGFSIANNQAIAHCQGEYILLLNPDTVVNEDTFRTCIHFMDAHPEAGGLGVRMIDGSGAFLPESKRGFPDPWVAFAKTFGLARLFPKSRLFNHYHLGYLDEHETHEVEVLAGAFMWLRKSVIDEIGGLDERFFMYGEDIDLSYRIVQAGYKNYYLPTTTIIHYKGESTKKGSLNYVRTFYKAMIIFARKHMGKQASLFVLMLQFAIYFRAFLTLVSNFFKRAYMPLLDALSIYIGLYFLRSFWASYHFKDPDYYDELVLYFNFPLYILIWLVTVYFSGGYDDRFGLRRLARGLLVGTVILAAVYGFLSLEYRSSRALILLGAAWALFITILLRFVQHFIQFGNFELGREIQQNLVIIGDKEESERVQSLLRQAEVNKNLIGTVSPGQEASDAEYLSPLRQLDEVVQIYKINELIFCSKDVSSQDIMYWMNHLGPALDYKIVPEESMSIIGSSSKNTAGELYTIEIRFQLAEPMNRRSKRFLDILLALWLLLTFPLQALIVRSAMGLLKNIWQVLSGQKTWVAYVPQDQEQGKLPALVAGVLSPLSPLSIKEVTSRTVQRINLLYAKDYQWQTDVDIIWKAYRKLGG